MYSSTQKASKRWEENVFFVKIDFEGEQVRKIFAYTLYLRPKLANKKMQTYGIWWEEFFIRSIFLIANSTNSKRFSAADSDAGKNTRMCKKYADQKEYSPIWLCIKVDMMYISKQTFILVIQIRKGFVFKSKEMFRRKMHNIPRVQI